MHFFVLRERIRNENVKKKFFFSQIKDHCIVFSFEFILKKRKKNEKKNIAKILSGLMLFLFRVGKTRIKNISNQASL